MANETYIKEAQFNAWAKDLAKKLGVDENNTEEMKKIKDSLELSLIAQNKFILWDADLDFSTQQNNNKK